MKNDRKELIMKKTFTLDEIDCANCAAKIERNIAAIDGVISATVSFMTQKLTIEANDADFDRILELAKEEVHKVEPDCRIIAK